jgi:hypothetical protein
VGIFASAPFAIVGSLVIPIGLLVAPSPDSIADVFFLTLFVLLFSACIFQVYARKRPIFKIYREGLWIRSLGTPISVNLFLNTLCLFIPIILIVFWQLITLQVFRVRTVRLHWENVDVMSGEDSLTIIDWFNKENLEDFGKHMSMEHYTVSYGAYSFRIPIDKVNEAVQFFLHNPDSRKMLPSWHDNRYS